MSAGLSFLWSLPGRIPPCLFLACGGWQQFLVFLAYACINLCLCHHMAFFHLCYVPLPSLFPNSSLFEGALVIEFRNHTNSAWPHQNLATFTKTISKQFLSGYEFRGRGIVQPSTSYHIVSYHRLYHTVLRDFFTILVLLRKVGTD